MLMNAASCARISRLLRQLPSSRGRVLLQPLTVALAADGAPPPPAQLDLAAFSAVSVLTLDRPAQRNALSAGMLADLADAVAQLEELPGRALLLRGAGATFCAGADVALLAELTESGEVSGAELCGFMQAVMRRLRALPCVSVALLEGAAVGGGAELATAGADLRLARLDARLRWPQLSLGLTPGFGGLLPLVRLAGERRALRVLLEGTAVDAPTAADWGLVDALLPAPAPDAAPAAASHDALCGAALWLQARLPLLGAGEGGASEEVVHAVKRLVHQAADSADTEALLGVECDVFAGLFGSAEQRVRLQRLRAQLANKM